MQMLAVSTLFVEFFHFLFHFFISISNCKQIINLIIKLKNQVINNLFKKKKIKSSTIYKNPTLIWRIKSSII